jgi:hypothetical protein
VKRRALVWLADMAGATGDAFFNAGAYEPVHASREPRWWETACIRVSEKCDAVADWLYDLADGDLP